MLGYGALRNKIGDPSSFFGSTTELGDAIGNPLK